MTRDAMVGIIVNPAAARDVRRLTSLARTIDVYERVNAVARVLRGLAGGRVATVLFMPEPAHVVARALDMLAAAGYRPGPDADLRIAPVSLPGGPEARGAADTASAASAMAEAGASVVVTVGGDGTNRAVVQGWPAAVLLPLPGGTNNAFGTPMDPTAAGLAAALFASDRRYAEHVRQVPQLEVMLASPPATTLALVDVAVVRADWVGAHALWDPALLVEAVVARSDPALTGLAGVGGMLQPLGPEPPRALHIRFGAGDASALVPLGPGQLAEVGIGGWQVLGLGESVLLGEGRADGRMTLAFDGEREIVLEPGASARVRLVAEGPRVLDGRGLLWAAAEGGALAGGGVAAGSVIDR